MNPFIQVIIRGVGAGLVILGFGGLIINDNPMFAITAMALGAITLLITGEEHNG